MSTQAMTWAIGQRTGGPSAKTVLWSIANYSNQYWCAWPSQKLIVEESEQSADSVQRRIPDLEALGLIRRIPLRYAGRKTIDFIILQPSQWFAASLEDIEPLLPRGCVVDPKYATLHAAADSGSDKKGTPLNALDPPLPQTLPQSADDAAALVRQHEPFMEPGKRERDVRAGRVQAESVPKSRLNLRPVEDEPREAAFRRLVQAYPPAAIDDEQKARREWGDVDEAEWQAAVDAIPRYLRSRKDIRRATIVGLEKYIRDRKWTGFPQPVAAAASAEPAVELKPFVVPLWAMLWGAIDNHLPADRVEYFLSRISKGLTTPASALPKDGEAAPLVPIKIGSDDHAAWVAYCEKLGFRLPRPDAVPVVFVPSEAPPPLKSSWKGYRLAVPQRLLFRSPAWWWRVHQITDNSIIEAQLSEGRRSHGTVGVDAGPWPSSGELAGMVEIVRLTDKWNAWSRWFDTKGVNLDLWSESSIWCPSEYPPLSVASTKELAT